MSKDTVTTSSVPKPSELTVEELLRITREVEESTPPPLVRPGEIVRMNSHNVERFGDLMDGAGIPYIKSNHLPNWVLVLASLNEFPGLRMILIEGEFPAPAAATREEK